MRLAWDPPTELVTREPLTDLGGYRIYSGCSTSGTYDREPILVDDPSVTSWIVDDLPDGKTCYFVVTALREVESNYSNEKAQQVVPPPGRPVIALRWGNLGIDMPISVVGTPVHVADSDLNPTFNYTAEAGGNRLLVRVGNFRVENAAAAALTEFQSIQFGTEGMVLHQHGEFQASNDRTHNVSIAHILDGNIPAGQQGFTQTYNGAPTSPWVAASALTLAGVDQANPVVATATDNGSGATADLSVAVVENGFVILAFTRQTAAIEFDYAAAGYTLLHEEPNNSIKELYVYKAISADGVETVQDAATNQRFAAIAVSYRPAAGMALTGSSQSESQVSGALNAHPGFDGAVVAGSSVAGGMDVQPALAGIAIGDSDLAASLRLLFGLSASLASESAAAGRVDLASGLSGQVATASQLEAALTLIGELLLAGDVSSDSELSAQLSRTLGISGDQISESLAGATMDLMQALGGRTDSVSAAVGALGLQLALAGDIAVQSVVEGLLKESAPGSVTAEAIRLLAKVTGNPTLRAAVVADSIKLRS